MGWSGVERGGVDMYLGLGSGVRYPCCAMEALVHATDLRTIHIHICSLTCDLCCTPSLSLPPPSLPPSFLPPPSLLPPSSLPPFSLLPPSSLPPSSNYVSQQIAPAIIQLVYNHLVMQPLNFAMDQKCQVLLWRCAALLKEVS